jgi:transposase
MPLKLKEKIYKTDHILEKYGHTVVTLPPYVCDLNPTELAWAKIKRIVRENNVRGDLSLQKFL